MDRNEELERQVAQLKSGLEARGRVGIAIGLMMERYHLADEQAFELLVRISQAENRKLKIIAEEIIGGRDVSAGSEGPEA
ncbi:hypothetical protein ASD11_14295 [Aeromicrobium sp. Root495]|uniref:ANTAR domain-containing protein n=1 Tax=Aeromicrobium sp. Root495 TaxID=1736550 RepID=UPI0006F4850C|nr:ANTAR domain-containing protein [Aeromicrobium sp. Root495]KQY55682.1 hypothetical protein ASD11_14295 [Aeromicrobium sp. Root495]